MKKIEAYMREKYPDEFKSPFDVESMEDKIVRMLEYMLELRKSSAAGCERIYQLKQRIILLENGVVSASAKDDNAL